VTNNEEVFNMLNVTRHQGNTCISSVNVEPSSSMSTSNSKIISQVNSLVKWSDVAAGRVKHCHQTTSVSLYNILTVINGQALPTGKSVPKYKKEKLVVKVNGTNNQHKDHKLLLLSDSHGRGCT
jgi:hypothetical protein